METTATIHIKPEPNNPRLLRFEVSSTRPGHLHRGKPVYDPLWVDLDWFVDELSSKTEGGYAHGKGNKMSVVLGCDWSKELLQLIIKELTAFINAATITIDNQTSIKL